MAAVSMAKPHVLVLDEPTNNLDLEAVEALAETVEKFEGGPSRHPTAALSQPFLFPDGRNGCGSVVGVGSC